MWQFCMSVCSIIAEFTLCSIHFTIRFILEVVKFDTFYWFGIHPGFLLAISSELYSDITQDFSNFGRCLENLWKVLQEFMWEFHRLFFRTHTESLLKTTEKVFFKFISKCFEHCLKTVTVFLKLHIVLPKSCEDSWRIFTSFLFVFVIIFRICR